MENHPQTNNFDPTQSPMVSLYRQLDATTPLALQQKFDDLDQELMHSGEWDYKDDKLELNQIKQELEAIDPDSLSDEERERRDEMLWFWHHHAAGVALFGYTDDETAHQFADTALKYQADGHPNKITGILYILSTGDVQAAEAYKQTEVSEVEQAAAEDAIQLYRQTHQAS